MKKPPVFRGLLLILYLCTTCAELLTFLHNKLIRGIIASQPHSLFAIVLCFGWHTCPKLSHNSKFVWQVQRIAVAILKCFDLLSEALEGGHIGSSILLACRDVNFPLQQTYPRHNRHRRLAGWLISLAPKYHMLCRFAAAYALIRKLLLFKRNTS